MMGNFCTFPLSTEVCLLVSSYLQTILVQVSDKINHSVSIKSDGKFVSVIDVIHITQAAVATVSFDQINMDWNS